MEHMHPISGIKDNLDVDFRGLPPTEGPAAPRVPTAFESEVAKFNSSAKAAAESASRQSPFDTPAKTGFEAEMRNLANGGRTPLDVPESVEPSPDETGPIETSEPADPLEVVATMQSVPLQKESSSDSPAQPASETSASAEKGKKPAAPSVSPSPASEPRKS